MTTSTINPLLPVQSSPLASAPVRSNFQAAYSDINNIYNLIATQMGTVTRVSIVSANGFAGTVANPTTTPDITLSTSVTGVLKGNGSAILAAIAGTDYSAGTSALVTGILKSTTTTGALSIATAGTDYQAPITLTTTGSSGAATFIGNVLNIPQYSGGGGGGNVTTTGTPVSGNLSKFSGSTSITNGDLSGDITTSGTLAATLATVNANTGSFGSSTSIPNFTVNGKGLITAAGSNVIIAPAGTLSGATLNSSVVNSSLTSVGTLAALTVTATITGSVSGNAGTATKWQTARNLAGNSVDGSANVAFANKFIVQGTTDAGLSGAQFLGALSTGILKSTTTTGVLSIATPGTDYEVPLTFSTGLTRTVNTITVNTSQNISTLSNLTSNGLIKTSGGTGALSIATAGTDYQAPITLTTTGTSGAATFIANTLNIPNYTTGSSPLTTKGDIFGFSSTNARVPVGGDGTVLTADSTQTLGVKWATVSGTGTVTTSGTPASGNLAQFSGSTVITNGNLSGDITTSGTLAATLTTVNANTGGFGSSTSIPSFTVNGKGLITAASGNVVIAPAGTLSGATLNSTVVNSSLTSVGTLAALTVTATITGSVSGNAGTATKWATARNLAGNSVDGSANVAFANKFIVQGTSDAGLSAAQFTGSLATGIVKNTTTTGVFSIAAAGTDYQAPISLTTTGTSGAATFIGNTLNIPNYATGAGTVTTTGSPATGNLTKFSGATSVTNGDLSGDITTSGTLAATLATVNTNTGSFGSSTSIPSFTVNGKGLITAASGNVVIAPAGTLSGATLNSTVVTSSLTSLGSQASALNMNSHQINSVSDPTSAQDAATKNYVDNALANLDSKPDVAYASTSALPANTYSNGTSGVGATLTGTSNGPLIIDSVTILIGQVGSRVLVAGEAAPANNGWYTITQQGVVAVSPYILTRATESDQAAEIGAGYLTGVVAPNSVIPGTANNGKVFISVANDPFTVGATSLTFSQVGSAYSAGTGLTLSGNAFSITNTAVSASSYGSSTAIPTFTVNAQGQLTAASTAAVIAPAGTLSGTSLNSSVVSSSLTSVGTLTGGATGAGFTVALTTSTVTGTLTVPNGGTGAGTLTGLVVGNGASAMTAVTAPSGTVVGTTDTQTLTNKRVTKRTGTTTSSATPTINTDNVDFYSITAQAAAITSFTTNLSGTPTNAQTLWISITDNGTPQTIAWGTSFEASTVALPTTTVTSTRLDVGFVWNTVTSKWRCVAVA